MKVPEQTIVEKQTEDEPEEFEKMYATIEESEWIGELVTDDSQKHTLVWPLEEYRK